MNVDELASEFGLSDKKPNQTKTKIPDNIDALAREYGLLPTTDNKPEKEKSWWQGFSTDPSWSGLAARIGIGAVRGAKDIIDTGAHLLGSGVSYVADKTLPESVAGPIRESVGTIKAEDKAARDEYDKEYKDSLAAGIGRVGGEIAATVPIMPARAMGAIATAVGAVPRIIQGGMRAAPLSNRLMASAGQGALGGAVFGAATSSTNDKSLGENVGEGAVTGALAGPLLTAVGQGAKSLVGAAMGTVSPLTARLAQRAEQLGIRLKGSQISDSHFLQKADQVTGWMPFSGAHGMTAQQEGQFARAVSRTFGDNTDTITRDVLRNARQREGARIENVGRNTTIHADQQLANDLRTVWDNIVATTDDTVPPAIRRQIQNIINKVDQNGAIPGEAYVNLTKKGSMLNRAQNSGNADIRHAANEIREALNNALQRYASPQQRQELLDARRKYKAVMTVRSNVEGMPDGAINILKLMRNVEKSPGGLQGAGELGEIAEIGRHFFKQPADSGTPLGNWMVNNFIPYIQNPLTGAGAVALAASQGATYLNAGLSAAGLAANRLLVRPAMNSNLTREAILRRASGATHGTANRLTESSVPYVTTPLDSENRIQINRKPPTYDVKKLPVSQPPQN